MDQTKSSLAAAEARLAELLAGSRRQEIEGARAAMEQAQSDLTIAELNLRRMRQLFERELVARQVFDEAQNQYQVAQAKLKAGSERFGLVEAGPRPEQIEAARAQVREAQANVELALANLANTLIVAPTDGTILERLAEVGETVTPNVFSTRGAKSAIVSMADLRDLRVDVEVNEGDLKKLRLNMPATIMPDAYPDRTYQGFLAEMAPEANRQKGTLAIKVQIRRPDNVIRPEMSAKVLFQEPPRPDGRRAGVFVPREAVVSRGNARLVYVVLGGRAVERPVTLGEESDAGVAIRDGLREDETVVIRGATALHDGQTVRVSP